MVYQILGYTAVLLVGSIITGTGVHYFRCTRRDFVGYADGSTLAYYCPFISEPEAVFTLNSIHQQNLQEQFLHDEKLPTPLPPPQEEREPCYDNDPPLRLGKHDVHQSHITLSGFSSGGTFAQQMFVAYSALIAGIATFSHAYYRCGPANAREADYDNACTLIGAANVSYNPDSAIEDIRLYERNGLIDSTVNLRDKKLYVYAGSRNQIFSLDQLLGAVRVLEPFIRDPCAIRTRVQGTTQLLPTDRFGGSCDEAAMNNLWVGNCGFSGAFEAVNFLLGDVIRSPMANTRPRMNHLLQFDQTEFFYGYNGDGHMDSVGFMYIPRQCQTQKCFLHFYFHGCFVGREFNGTDHIVNSGFLELAEVNNLIIVFPQVKSFPPENRIGCWDTYGLTGQLYATKLGAQVRVVRNMIARILGTDNNPEVPEPQRDYESNNRINKREREPLSLKFQIFKGKEVILQR